MTYDDVMKWSALALGLILLPLPCLAQAVGNGANVGGPYGNSNAPIMLIGGLPYALTLDDEFTKDSTLSATDDTNGVAIGQADIWKTTFPWGGRSNNAGTDDAYYEPLSGCGTCVFSTSAGQPLAITAQHLSTPITPGGGDTTPRNWASGCLSSTPFTYGYVEFQAEIPNLQGFWPALWLQLPNSTYGNAAYFINGASNSAGGPEYDLAEIFGNAYGAGVVQETSIENYTPGTSTYNRFTVATAGSSFHTYGLLWTPTTVKFYIDRVQEFSSVNYLTGPMSAIITLQVFASGTYAPAPANNNPQAMYINYFRLWQTI